MTYEAGETATASADVCLVAVGRGPVTDGLDLEGVGVELDRGFVKVDGQLQTSASHVWAVGDVAATPLQLAHVAFTEGIAVAERISGQSVPEIDYVGIPRVTYCTPRSPPSGSRRSRRSSAGATSSWRTSTCERSARPTSSARRPREGRRGVGRRTGAPESTSSGPTPPTSSPRRC